MSRLLDLLTVSPGDGDTWIGPATGPAGKRSFGGQFTAQSLAAAARTVDAGRPPTNMHLQFLRGGEAGDPVAYDVTPVFDGRTAASRRVDSRQDGRLLTTATVSFAAPMAGPEHGRRPASGIDANTLECTGPAGPAPSLPLDELDIRIVDDRTGGGFVRQLWWRVTVPLPDDPLIHTLVAVYVTDVYGIDPALQQHRHSMRARTHRSGTTDSSIWFHQAVRADEWNLLESTSPAAARGRGLVTSSLVRADGVVAATLVQEGLIAER
ncbi:acyl-CoA thioesterase II [Mycolicibacterium sp. F2034L]|uniref:acyl-CoA thioesterase n=1 Tax=Mycolicibacterium sp. F2034L TaxID=2926422 RepID=UPI001FF30EE8|nr:acyl-CoA thioesterase domain-containing protein [Mycolicibacterium sp. F2034L]MCK0175088.1 thioesterase family protein [Mycolicibacterium sp. F2034L]